MYRYCGSHVTPGVALLRSGSILRAKLVDRTAVIVATGQRHRIVIIAHACCATANHFQISDSLYYMGNLPQLIVYVVL